MAAKLLSLYMTVIGSLVKKGVELNQFLQSKERSAVQDQQKQLLSLLEKAKDTAIGKYYDFQGILSSDKPEKEFKSRLPISTYETIHQDWWYQQQQFPDISWPDKPNFFALSSGTTGKSSKRIPITEEFLQSMRDVGQSLISELPNFDFPEELFESEILMLSSSANLSKHEQGHLEGEISGINVSNFPGWYDLFYRPGKEIAGISNWDERIERIVEEAPDWNIGAIAGIPSWVLLMLRAIVQKHNLDTIHDIWPNLTVYASGGVAFETFRKDFDELSKKPLTIIDTYLASEGFFAFSTKPDSLAMRLATHHGYYYEFIPFDEAGVDETGQILPDPKVIGLDEVALDKEYVLVVSTCAGAWRYIIGDTIKFTALESPEILITGRTKFFLNAVGSQLSEEKLDEAVLKISEELGASINEYCVAALENSEKSYFHQWVIVAETENLKAVEIAQQLDEFLMDANKNYAGARDKALAKPQVSIASKKLYYNFLEKDKKKGGQIKTPKVMKAEKMNSFLTYLSNATGA